MGKNKLAKFAEMAVNPLVVEGGGIATNDSLATLRSRWRQDFFKNDNPIVLELGCGRGEYTVGLGRLFPEINFIGVDIKGARMWTGATEAFNAGMTNVGFLRTHIEFIDRFFAPNEVAEIWLTFSDPQMKKATKRLTSTGFLARYRRFMVDGGLIHLKPTAGFSTPIHAMSQRVAICPCCSTPPTSTTRWRPKPTKAYTAFWPSAPIMNNSGLTAD